MRLLLAATLGDTLRAFYLPLVRHLRKAGWQVDGLGSGISTCPNCCDAFDHVWEIPWSRNPLDPHNLLIAPRMIASIVRSNSHDLVHVSTPVAAFVTRFALRRLRKQGRPKVIYTAHGFHFHKVGGWLENSVYLGAERLAGRWTDCLTVMNTDDEIMAEQYRVVPQRKLVHIPGVGIDRELYSPESVPASAVAAIRRELNLDQQQPLFFMMAEFIARKRHKDALKALALMRCTAARLALAGDGPLLETMKRHANELGIADRVHFLGHRRDISALVRASVATLLPSAREGLPRSIMESMSLAVPVIGSDVRGTRDLLAGGGGLLVNLGDIQSLARSMDWVASNPDAAREMGQRGRAALEKYDLQSIVRLHEAVYQRVLSDSPLQEIEACAH
jgi:glycosyltransferase involved in cell wall biosynthesis